MPEAARGFRGFLPSSCGEMYVSHKTLRDGWKRGNVSNTATDGRLSSAEGSGSGSYTGSRGVPSALKM